MDWTPSGQGLRSQLSLLNQDRVTTTVEFIVKSECHGSPRIALSVLTGR